jgi:hemolysin III
VETPAKPRWRGLLHQIAFFVSLPMGAVLVALAGSGRARLASIVFALSLAGVFGVSAAYHRGSWTEAARRRMKRLDHSMIFILIAGSYTPLCLLAIHGPWAAALLVAVWGGAVVGISLKLAAPDRLSGVTGFLYIATGWIAVLALPQLLRDLTPVTSTLVVAGGVLYTLGAITLARRRPDPRPTVFGYHEVWHALGIGAGLCHWSAILLVVLAAR